MQPILTRVGGLDAVFDWTEVLSGGEKQRVGFARLLYHRPKFAILDECSSAISVDVEGQLYERCRALGITLFSVSHRKSLWRHHEYLLRYDGQGGYEYRPLTQQDISTAWGS
jgi:ATP-binding cassette, subfamily D (ALD), member 3